MVLDNIGKSLNNALKKIFSKSIIDDESVKELLKDIQRALLLADVNADLVMNISEEVKNRLLENKIPKGVSKRDYIVKTLWTVLTDYLGKKTEILQLDLGKPNLIMMVGIQGSGKTTTIGKLARYYQKKGIKTGVICADNFRPGAYDQLQQLVTNFNISFYGDKTEKDAVVLAKNGYKYMKDLDIELILLDTSGRHSEEDSLIKEMKSIIEKVEPKEVILVIDGTLGQQASKQASAFKTATDIGSIIVTKLDGSSKGGGALSAVAETGAPIKFIGVGENIDDINVFEPKQFVGSMLGIPDLEGLIRKIEDAEISMDEDVNMRFMKGQFTLLDMMEQIKSIQKLGSLNKIAEMLGFKYKMSESDLNISKEKIRKWDIIMNSMTQKELKNPKIIKSSRRTRIAKGSGTSLEAIRDLLTQYEQMKSLMKKMGKKRKTFNFK